MTPNSSLSTLRYITSQQYHSKRQIPRRSSGIQCYILLRVNFKVKYHLAISSKHVMNAMSWKPTIVWLREDISFAATNTKKHRQSGVGGMNGEMLHIIVSTI